MTYSQISSLRRNRYKNSRSLSCHESRSRSHSNSQVASAKSSLRYLIVILILVCLLILIYLFQVSTTNSYSYIINDLDKEEANLSQQVEQMEFERRKLQSNHHLHDLRQEKGDLELILPTPDQVQILE